MTKRVADAGHELSRELLKWEDDLGAGDDRRIDGRSRIFDEEPRIRER